MYYNEAMSLKRDYFQEIRRERQVKNQIYTGNNRRKMEQSIQPSCCKLSLCSALHQPFIMSRCIRCVTIKRYSKGKSVKGNSKWRDKAKAEFLKEQNDAPRCISLSVQGMSDAYAISYLDRTTVTVIGNESLRTQICLHFRTTPNSCVPMH